MVIAYFISLYIVATSVRNVFVLFRVRAGDSGGFSERMLLWLLLLLLLLFWVRCELVVLLMISGVNGLGLLIVVCCSVVCRCCHHH